MLMSKRTKTFDAMIVTVLGETLWESVFLRFSKSSKNESVCVANEGG